MMPEVDEDQMDESGVEQRINSVKIKSYNSKDDESETESLTPLCGISSCRPAALQPFANITTFTISLSVVLLMCVSYTRYQMGSVRTLERRFNLSSTKSGILGSIIDAMQSLAAGFIGYLGGRLHKPRLIFTTTVITAAGILLFASPYFIYGPKDLSAHAPTADANVSGILAPGFLCAPQRTGSDSEYDDNCAASEPVQPVSEDVFHLPVDPGPFAILVIASIVSSQGSSPAYCLGIPYIEENTNAQDAPVYIGFAFSMYGWAKLAGLLLAALFTSLPEDISGGSSLPPSDPAFIGAWWLGYVILSILVVISSVPMLFFPEHFELYYSGKRTWRKVNFPTQQGAMKHVKGFIQSVLRLMTNGTYLAMNLSDICAIYVWVGVLSQLPRTMEIHFHQPSYMANIISAASAAVSGIAGIILGGALLKKFRLSTLGAARVYVGALVVGLVGTLLAMSCGCPQEHLAGQQDQLTGRFQVTQPCNAECACPPDIVDVVCDRSHVMYLTPCHAGCTGDVTTSRIYTNCSCVSQFSDDADDSLSSEYCSTSCPSLIPYVIIIFVTSFVGSIGSVPSIMIVLSLVDTPDKSIAMSIRSTLMNLLCFVPGPILFGVIIDSTCRVWSTSCAAVAAAAADDVDRGGVGACLIYDTARYRILTHGITAVFQFVSVVAGAIAYVGIRCRSKRLVPDGRD